MDLAQILMLMLGTEIPAGTEAKVLGFNQFTPDTNVAQIEITGRKFNLWSDGKKIVINEDDPNDPAF